MRPDFVDQLILASREYMVDQLSDSPLSKMPSRGPYTPQAPGNVPDIRTSPASVFPEADVTIQPGGQTLRVLHANTPALQAVGVQNRDDVGMANGTYDGALFQFSEDVAPQLHTKDVSFPLSAAFFDSSGTYRGDHFHLEPGDEVGKRAAMPARYALEVHRNDFDSLGLTQGSRISVAATGKSGPDQKKNPTDITV